MQIKFIIFFTIIGFLISLIGGISTGNKWLYITTTTLLSSLGFGLFGLLIYFILEKKVPEILEVFGGVSIFSKNEMRMDDNFNNSKDFDSDLGSSMKGNKDKDLGSIPVAQIYTGGGQSTGSIGDKIAKKKKNSIDDEYITVDNVSIKNEPKIMAEAVRTIMSMDND